jgi:hypothetical protein
MYYFHRMLEVVVLVVLLFLQLAVVLLFLQSYSD